MRTSRFAAATALLALAVAACGGASQTGKGGGDSAAFEITKDTPRPRAPWTR